VLASRRVVKKPLGVYVPFLPRLSWMDQYPLWLCPTHGGRTHIQLMIVPAQQPALSYDEFHSKGLRSRVSYRCKRKYRIISQPWPAKVEAYVYSDDECEQNQRNARGGDKHNIRAVVGRGRDQKRSCLPRRYRSMSRCRHVKIMKFVTTRACTSPPKKYKNNVQPQLKSWSWVMKTKLPRWAIPRSFIIYGEFKAEDVPLLYQVPIRWPDGCYTGGSGGVFLPKDSSNGTTEPCPTGNRMLFQDKLALKQSR